MSEHIKISVDGVYAAVQARPLTRTDLLRKFGVDEREERDRPRVWRIGQVLAQLIGRRRVKREVSPADGKEYYRGTGVAK